MKTSLSNNLKNQGIFHPILFFKFPLASCITKHADVPKTLSSPHTKGECMFGKKSKQSKNEITLGQFDSSKSSNTYIERNSLAENVLLTPIELNALQDLEHILIWYRDVLDKNKALTQPLRILLLLEKYLEMRSNTLQQQMVASKQYENDLGSFSLFDICADINISAQEAKMGFRGSKLYGALMRWREKTLNAINHREYQELIIQRRTRELSKKIVAQKKFIGVRTL
jgi:hypothetical protein